MKIENIAKEQFQPIDINLKIESEAELKSFIEFFGNLSFAELDAFITTIGANLSKDNRKLIGNFADKMYTALINS